MIRLVASDLDGTLLGPDDLVPALNREALDRAKAVGVPVVVATGRPSRWLDVIADLPILPQVIVSNGAAIFDLNNDCFIERHTIDSDVILAVANEIRSRIPGTTFGIECGHIFGREPETPSLEVSGPQVETAPLAELVGRPGVLKLLAYHPQITSQRLYEATCAGWFADLEVTYSTTRDQTGLVELGPSGVTKATALSHLCQQLGITSAEVIAFGDMPNDLPLLNFAGQPRAMGNAHPDLDGFPRVASNADSGVGRELLSLFASYPQI